MLASSQRLTIPLFKNVMDKGRSMHSSLFIFRLAKIGGNSRFSVSVSKKVAKKAVDRNKIRRRAYSVLNSLYSRIQNGFHGVLIAKNTASKAPFQEISADIEGFFVKSGLLK